MHSFLSIKYFRFSVTRKNRNKFLRFFSCMKEVIGILYSYISLFISIDLEIIISVTKPVFSSSNFEFP